MESDKFCFSGVKWIYQQSRELGRFGSAPQRVGIESVIVLCKGCQHSWHAGQHGTGRLLNVLGGVIVSCPSCAARESVQGSLFEQKPT
jgi:hypothetical protein